MPHTSTTSWIRAGLFALPLYGLLTARATIGGQPDATRDPWAGPASSAPPPPGGLLGLAVGRSGVLPRWAGALWAAAFVVFILLGAALGKATTGASPPPQPIGAGLMTISDAWMAYAALRQPAVPAVVAEPRTSRA